MTDRNYNDLDKLDLRRIKTCEQVREERLQAKLKGIQEDNHGREELL